jgi:ubiquinone biosynthesis protein
VKIKEIRHAYHHLHRYQEILGVLAKYGFAEWVNRLNLDFAQALLGQRVNPNIGKLPLEAKVRMALTELGPTFIKLGQVLSVRPDLVGIAQSDELVQLQDNVPSDSIQSVQQVIETELKHSIKDLFQEFNETSLASASVSQVHRALLKSGEEVVVKVQRPGIEGKIQVDLEILVDLADLIEKYVEESRPYRPRATVEEFRRTLLRELDFQREARHMELFAQDFAHDPTVHIPRVFQEYTTRRVLTMEFLSGTRLSDKESLEKAGIDLTEIALRGVDIFLQMIFTHGFYHADPHPGNLLVLPGGVIGLVDFGMVGRLDDELREDIEDLLMAIVSQNGPNLVSAITKIGSVPPGLNKMALQADVIDYISYYGNLPLQKVKLSQALGEMTEIIRRHRIILPSGIAMLLKTLIILEGTGRLLNPRFDLLTAIQPYQHQILVHRLSPKRQLQKLQRLYTDLERLTQTVPPGVVEIIQKLRTGEFDLNLNHKGLERLVNRLVFGIITAALFLGATFMMSFQVPPLIKGISILGWIDYLLAIAFGLRLLWAIHVSGRL